jgi:ADP-ribose pyrophosphatase YjhB (NUDIX family)
MSREYPTRPIAAVAATIIHEGKVLLAIRGNSPNRGKWGIPGGVIELGETTEQAVAREVLEETNIIVKPKRLITVLDSIGKDQEGKIRVHYILLEYFCEYISGEVHPASDAPDARWVPISDLDTLDMMSVTRDLVVRVAREEGLLE